jgi:dolichol-phosphate mannosyltransferase
VIPAYNEDGNLRVLYSELKKILPILDVKWEIIFVDDGSTDTTWNEILLMHEVDKSVKGIRLSRNFGHQYALLAGLSHSLGDAVITMDADLQHPPHVISDLISEWKKGNKIVNTFRTDPEDFSFFKKIASRMFYKVFSLLTGVKMDIGMADFRLLDRQVVNDVLQFQEKSLFLRGLVQWVGYQNSRVTYKSQNRYSGASKYSLKKMVRFALDGITSFSIIPLRISIFIGFFTSIISFGGIFYALYAKYFTNTAVPGWASTIAILSFLLGILFILLGIMGDYIGRILIEVKQRPRYLVSAKVGLDVPSLNKIDWTYG